MAVKGTRVGPTLTRRELLELLGVTGAAAALAACAPSPGGGPSSSATASAAAGAPQRGGSVTVALTSNITTLDPRIAGTNNALRLVTHTYTNTLVRLNEKLEYEPELAESWERSTDGLTYTLKLRKGVKFHDGSPFTSKDVKFTLESVMDPALKSSFRTGWVLNNTPTKVEAPDEYTVRLTFAKEPDEPLYTIAFQRIVPKDYTERVGADSYGAKPVGTGPFHFVSQQAGDKVTFERNPDFWKPGLPYLDQLIFRIIPDPATRLAAIQANEIQVVAPPGLNPDDLAITAKDPDLVNYNQLFAGYHYMAFNERDPIFKDKRVRQAISYAVDTQEIINAIVVGQPAWNNVAKQFKEFDPSSPHYALDVSKTKALLAEAGYPNGIDFTISELAAPQPYTKVAEVVQNQLNRTGVIRAKLQLLDFTTGFIPKVFSAPFDYQAAISAFTSVSALAAFSTYYGATAQNPTDNFMAYKNSALQKAYDDAKAARFADPKKYQDNLNLLQKIIIDDAPAAFLGYWGNSVTTRKTVQGFIGHPIQSFEYMEQLWLKK
jgi:peptide/nickel transport system substrate-binding protein